MKFYKTLISILFLVSLAGCGSSSVSSARRSEIRSVADSKDFSHADKVKMEIKNLKSWNLEVRKSAAKKLGELGDARAVNPLISALKDKKIRTEVTDALGKIGEPAVHPLIAECKKVDKKPPTYPRNPSFLERYEIAIKVLLSDLEDSLQTDENDARLGACYALAKIRDPRAVESLIASLAESEKPHLQRSAAIALGEIGDPRAVEPLILALSDRDVSVSAAAKYSLIKIGSPSVEVLIRKGQGGAIAAEILGEIGDRRAVEYLVAILERGGRFAPAAAAKGLGRIGDPRAVEPLIRVLRDPSSGADVLREVVKALGEIRDSRAVEPLLAVYLHNSSVENQARDAIIKIGTPAVMPLIISLIGIKHENIRREIELMLAEIGEPTLEPLARTICMVLLAQMAEVNTAKGLPIQIEGWNYLMKTENFMAEAHNGKIYTFGPAYKYMPLTEEQTDRLIQGAYPRFSPDTTLLAFIGPGKGGQWTLKIFDCENGSLRETDLILAGPENLQCPLSWARDEKAIYAVIKSDREIQIIGVNTDTGKIFRAFPVSREPKKLDMSYAKEYASYLADGSVYTINFENHNERNINAELATLLGISNHEITCYSFNWLPERDRLTIALKAKEKDLLIIYNVKNNSFETQLELNSFLLADNVKPELIGAIQQIMPLNTEKILVLANLVGTTARTKTYRTRVSPPLLNPSSAAGASHYTAFQRSSPGWRDALWAATSDATQQSLMTKEVTTEYIETSTYAVPAIFVVDTVGNTMVPLRLLLKDLGQVRLK